MIRHYGLTEKEAANSFTDDELEMMAASGNNPQSNVCKEVLALRAVLQSFVSAEQLIKHLSSNQDSDAKALVEEIKQSSNNCTIGVLAFIDAMIQDEPVSNGDEFPTKFKPVADLYGITSPTGSETSFTFDAAEASGFAKGGWSVQEYVELEHYQDAMSGNSPATLDGWIPVSERMPDEDGNYWGWWSESKRQGPVWFIKSELQAQFQSSEITHWMPLPTEPQEVG